MRHESLSIAPRPRRQASGDLITLQEMQELFRRAMAAARLAAYAKSRELEYLDPDEVMAGVESYFGADGPWKDLLTDAFHESKTKCYQEAVEPISNREG